MKGWNKDGDSYAFRYEDPTGDHPGPGLDLQLEIDSPNKTALNTAIFKGTLTSAKSCPCRKQKCNNWWLDASDHPCPDQQAQLSEAAATSAGKRDPIMVKMVPLGEHLLLQWMAPKSFREPRHAGAECQRLRRQGSVLRGR